ncbi:MAG TPA: histidine phosphatase family protein [Steroidobacteraceae bacterium]
MELILWRHAEAAAGDPDSARPLTELGRAQAQSMARWLAPRLPADLRIIVSPARRAQETALTLARSFETSEHLAPGTDVAILTRLAGWPDAKRPVMLVGHQPTLGETAARLIDGRQFSWRIGAGAVWWLRSRQRKGRSEAVLLLAIEPEILALERDRGGH